MISGILIAGGKSSRMGESKAFIRYKSKFLYEYPLEILDSFCDEVIISATDPRYNHLKYRVIADEIPGKGPIGGLYTCLKEIRSEQALVLPCDVPLLNKDHINLLLEESEKFEISLFQNEKELPEPLIGVYSRSLVPVLEKMISDQNYKLSGLFKFVPTRFVTYEKNILSGFSDLKNINTPDDLQSLNKLP